MPRKFQIKDGQGKVIGRFTAPDGATKEEIERVYAKYRQQLLAKRAAKEAARTEPSVGVVICSLCRNPVPADQVGSHVRREVRDMDLGIGDGQH